MNDHAGWLEDGTCVLCGRTRLEGAKCLPAALTCAHARLSEACYPGHNGKGKHDSQASYSITYCLDCGKRWSRDTGVSSLLQQGRNTDAPL